MHNKLLTLFLFCFAISGCKKEMTIQFSSESMTEASLELCAASDCPEITINYLEVLGDNEASTAINEAVQDFVLASLNIGEDDTPSAKSITEAANQFVTIYHEEKAEYYDMTSEYEAEISVSETYSSKNFLSLEMRQYKFTGGAHGFGSTIFKNFDTFSGEEISIGKLLKNEGEFTNLAERHFRRKYEIAENESVNAPGFWFEDDVFQLPENIGFSEENVILIYNQYEIASYADGPIEISFPIKEAQSFLNYKLAQ